MLVAPRKVNAVSSTKVVRSERSVSAPSKRKISTAQFKNVQDNVLRIAKDTFKTEITPTTVVNDLLFKQGYSNSWNDFLSNLKREARVDVQRLLETDVARTFEDVAKAVSVARVVQPPARLSASSTPASEVASVAVPAAFTKGSPIENVQARIDALTNRPVRGSAQDQQAQEAAQQGAKTPVQNLIDKHLSHLSSDVQHALLNATYESLVKEAYEEYAPSHDFITALNQLPSSKGVDTPTITAETPLETVREHFATRDIEIAALVAFPQYIPSLPRSKPLFPSPLVTLANILPASVGSYLVSAHNAFNRSPLDYKLSQTKKQEYKTAGDIANFFNQYYAPLLANTGVDLSAYNDIKRIEKVLVTQVNKLQRELETAK